MILSLAVALVLSQSSVKKVEIIRGGSSKKAPRTETALSPAPSSGPTAEQQAREQQLQEKSIELNQRADELKAKDSANEAKKENDAKIQAAQSKILEKHARDLQTEYEKAANGLAGQE
jgi:hypothetical protein